MPKQAGGNYDRLAWVYDELAGLAYGGRIKGVQRFLISHIPPQATVLILGGGTGWILPEILALRPDVYIDYVEPSAAMMHKTQSYLNRLEDLAISHVTLFSLPESDFPLQEKYEVVFTAFFLDLFERDELQEVASRIDARLRGAGLWLWADFVVPRHPLGKIIGRVLIGGMYGFFRLTTGLRTQRLIPLTEIPLLATYLLESHRQYLGGFVQGKVFRKPST